MEEKKWQWFFPEERRDANWAFGRRVDFLSGLKLRLQPDFAIRLQHEARH